MSHDTRLEMTLRNVEPALRLVSERHLRKVLNYLRDWDHPVPLNASLPLWVSRKDLEDVDVLPPAALEGHESQLLLVTTPDDRLIAELPLDRMLREYWQLLFRAFLERELRADARPSRLAEFSPSVQREIQHVLEVEHLAAVGCDGPILDRAFTATMLTQLHFTPKLIADFFPSLPNREEVTSLVGFELDVNALLQRSRPAGAAESNYIEPEANDESLPGEILASREASRLAARTDAAERRGNLVRAAILRTRAGISAQPVLDRLIASLAAVFQWEEAERSAWMLALTGLLSPAAVGAWPRAARCLYELQKIATDAGREIYAIDLVESIRTLGRRPVKRALPLAAKVAPLMHLKAAQGQLVRSKLREEVRERLGELLHHEIHEGEHLVRAEITPLVEGALTAAGFVPQSRVEIVAREKVVAELLDRICERGYLRFGNLRDAIARNQLKLNDLSGPMELLGGDPLLRADTRLSYDLDGVYRRGEFYLRFLHRSSSAFFGTGLGRVLFLYLILPFLGAFMTVVFAEEVTHIGSKVFHFVSKIMTPPVPPPESSRPVPASERMEYDPVKDEFVWIDTNEAVDVATTAIGSSSTEHSEFDIPWDSVLVLGFIYLILFHVPAVRHALLALLSRLLSLLRYVLWDLPSEAWKSPSAKALRHSRVVRVIYHYFSGALIVTGAVVAGMTLLGAPWLFMVKVAGSVFLSISILANTRIGWVLQERVAESLTDWLRLVRVNLIPGFIGWVLGGFRWLANWFERRLYAIDEWLRFRGGDSQRSFALKAAIGLVWFPIAYVARFAFYLLIEPQINPVKHFPVVTVSHKVILPMFPTVAELLNVSNETAFTILGCVPGIFGFIAWELMANWQLYRVNRSKHLKPAVIGSHGESMRGLLRPGFHSGTVPRHFRQLRKADRRGNTTKASQLHHDLDHTAEGVHRFIERELLPLLEGSAAWGNVPVLVASVHFGCQRVVIELAAPSLGQDLFSFAFENREGKIEASILRAGWFDRLEAGPQTAFCDALRGIFDMSAAERFEGKPRETPDQVGGDSPRSIEFTQCWLWDNWVKKWDADRVVLK